MIHLEICESMTNSVYFGRYVKISKIKPRMRYIYEKKGTVPKMEVNERRNIVRILTSMA